MKREEEARFKREEEERVKRGEEDRLKLENTEKLEEENEERLKKEEEDRFKKEEEKLIQREEEVKLPKEEDKRLIQDETEGKDVIREEVDMLETENKEEENIETMITSNEFERKAEFCVLPGNQENITCIDMEEEVTSDNENGDKNETVKVKLQKQYVKPQDEITELQQIPTVPQRKTKDSTMIKIYQDDASDTLQFG